MILDGYYGDSAITIPVGAISESAERLLKVTEESLELALDKVRLGNRLGDVSATVQHYAEKNGYCGGEGVCGPRNRQIDARGTADSKLSGSPGMGPS